MLIRPLVLLAILLAGSAARAQEAPVAPAPPIVAPDALAGDLAKYGEMYKRGFYDELIFNVNQQIAALPQESRDKPDARLLYFRGLSYYKLGWFERAKADLLVAQAAKIGFLPGGFGTKWALQYIEERTPFVPPKIEEVRDGERVIFRMHYFGMEGGTAMIMGMLPTAYRINREIFGSEVEATTIYVFDDYEQFVAYYKQVYQGKNPGSWYAAVTLGDIVLVSLRDTKGVLRARDARVTFQKTIVHEFNHAMLNRLMGTANQPRWFKEGLAQIAGARVDTDFDEREQQALRRLFENDAVIPPGKFEGDSSTEQTELGIALRKAGRPLNAPDPYTQGYGMTKYLLDHISTAQLQSFLNRVRESDDFAASFQDEFGFSLEQFFQRWKADYQRQLATR